MVKRRLKHNDLIKNVRKKANPKLPKKELDVSLKQANTDLLCALFFLLASISLFIWCMENA